MLQPNYSLIEEELYSRFLAEESLYEFTKQAWHVIEPNPFVGAWYIQAECEHAEALMRRQILNLLVNVPP